MWVYGTAYYRKTGIGQVGEGRVKAEWCVHWLGGDADAVEKKRDDATVGLMVGGVKSRLLSVASRRVAYCHVTSFLQPTSLVLWLPFVPF